MPKTLLVTYLPHGKDSKTKLLVEAFLETIKNKNVELDTLNLLENTPDFFREDTVAAYYKRNLGGQQLTTEESKIMAKADAYAAQFKNADLIVLAHPIHNFSVPAMVKAYIDAITQYGVTFSAGPDGNGFPMTGKKIMILSTSMGTYLPGTPTENIDFGNRLERHIFGTSMKFGTVEIINGGGMFGSEEEKLARLQPFIEQVKTVTNEWYA